MHNLIKVHLFKVEATYSLYYIVLDMTPLCQLCRTQRNFEAGAHYVQNVLYCLSDNLLVNDASKMV